MMFQALLSILMAIGPSLIFAFPAYDSVDGTSVVADQIYQAFGKSPNIFILAEELRSDRICKDWSKNDKLCHNTQYSIVFRSEDSPLKSDCQKLAEWLKDDDNSRRCETSAKFLNADGDHDGGSYLAFVYTGTCAVGISWEPQLGDEDDIKKYDIYVATKDMIEKLEHQMDEAATTGQDRKERATTWGKMDCEAEKDKIKVYWSVFNPKVDQD
ncbi:hypothetical protein MKZ38_004278 [Zalerion maritima]|uniref:Ecp2 effector protein-like domain-containing protein n=1 Tax=Zalerion maritima TaxID=339359 RepID=A0AAD5WQ10_9PEZI|nr:hypothetical protein MKZ38_004278 [Zalerion maritima]